MKVNANEYIGKNVYVKVDRPIGSSHPNYPDHIYLVNYGFVPNTISGDGEELDCYILGEYKPIKEYTGKCIAVIHRLNDDDDKLIITSKGRNFTNKEIDVVIEFQEKFYKIALQLHGRRTFFRRSRLPEGRADFPPPTLTHSATRRIDLLSVCDVPEPLRASQGSTSL